MEDILKNPQVSRGLCHSIPYRHHHDMLRLICTGLHCRAHSLESPVLPHCQHRNQRGVSQGDAVEPVIVDDDDRRSDRLDDVDDVPHVCGTVAPVAPGATH